MNLRLSLGRVDASARLVDVSHAREFDLAATLLADDNSARQPSGKCFVPASTNWRWIECDPAGHTTGTHVVCLPTIPHCAGPLTLRHRMEPSSHGQICAPEPARCPFSVGGLSAKRTWLESAWRGAGCVLGPVRRIRGGERQTAGIAGKVVHSNTRIHRMKLFINSAFIRDCEVKIINKTIRQNDVIEYGIKLWRQTMLQRIPL